MSATQAKVSRQQIRKAFGAKAVDHLADLSANLDDLRQSTSAMESAHAERIAALEADRARLKTLRQRLIWVFRG